jgi:hypothetical protein
MTKRAFLMVAVLMSGVATVKAQTTVAKPPTISNCGSTAVPKADQTNRTKLETGIACFNRAGVIATDAVNARKAFLAKLPAPAPTPVPTPTPTPKPSGWVACGLEDDVCGPITPAVVRYGVPGKWNFKLVQTGVVVCSNEVFGDPAVNVKKACEFNTDVSTLPAPSPTPTPTPVPLPTPTPSPAGPIKPTVIGMNVSGPVYYATERVWANLAYGAGGWKDPAVSWNDDSPRDKLNAYGYPVSSGVLAINVPQAVWANKATSVTCTWEGFGKVRVDSDAGGYSESGSVIFTWRGFDFSKIGQSRPSLLLYVTGAKDFRNLDCREPGVEQVGVFDKRYVDDVKPFKLLRFLDWSAANGNPPLVTWATRSTPTSGGNDGTAVEHMVALANAADSDAWFTIPWNADADYIKRHGEYVRANLKPGRSAYYELSNEVWNFQFGQTTQALNEGVAQGLAADRYTNHLYRLGQKSTEMMKILTPIFADQPGKLVRVISAQNDNPWAGERVLEFKDTAKWHDAFATAPYFGHSFFDPPNDKLTVSDLDAAFTRLAAQRVFTLDRAKANWRLAQKFGLRYITYEAGQHIISPNGPTAVVAEAMQRDPRMKEQYDLFLAEWKRDIGDNLTMYSHTGTISQYGAWGMREYAAQPLSETPKRQAILNAIGQVQ